MHASFSIVEYQSALEFGFSQSVPIFPTSVFSKSYFRLFHSSRMQLPFMLNPFLRFYKMIFPWLYHFPLCRFQTSNSDFYDFNFLLYTNKWLNFLIFIPIICQGGYSLSSVQTSVKPKLGPPQSLLFMNMSSWSNSNFPFHQKSYNRKWFPKYHRHYTMP